MKRYSILLALLLCSVFAVSQQTPNSYSAGFYYSPNYGQWVGRLASGNAATGSQTVTLQAPTVVTPDGVTFVPYSTTVPITVDAGANAETVTPSAVSGCVFGASSGSCSVTATFSNTHAAGTIVQSGDAGYNEALNDAGAKGGGLVFFQNDSGIVTLSTGGTTTDTTANLLPANSVITSATGIVTTTISGGTCTAWGIGDPTTATRFTPTTIALTAGTKSTSVLPAFLGSAIASATTGSQQGLSAAKVRITCATGAPGAGAVKVRVTGYTFVAPAS